MQTIQRYQIRIPGQDPERHRATIFLVGEGTLRAALGRVHFLDDGSQLPADAKGDDGLIDMHLPLAAFAGVVAMLQHDRPVMISFRGGRGELRTGEWEPVGETEGA